MKAGGDVSLTELERIKVESHKRKRIIATQQRIMQHGRDSYHKVLNLRFSSHTNTKLIPILTQILYVHFAKYMIMILPISSIAHIFPHISLQWTCGKTLSRQRPCWRSGR